MATPLARRPEAGGASPQVVPAGSGTAGYAVPASLRGIGAQAAGVLGLLTGLWVALSPWFITLQDGGRDGRLRPRQPPRVFRPAARQPAAGHLADHLPAHPGPQAPHRPRDVLVQQLLRRGADRPGGGRPRLRGPAPNRPLTASGLAGP